MFSASKTAAPVSGAYQISNSVRLRSPASAYFSRTQKTPSNGLIFTYSFCYKPSLASTNAYALEGYVDDINRDYITFNNNNLNFGVYHANTSIATLITTQVFRDPSAWYYFLIVYDSTQSVASNRIKAYVNGVQITSFSTATYPSLNQATYFNAANAQIIGRSNYGPGVAYLDGYLADINFIDGQALTPSSFGQISPTTGVWQPAKYTGSYGTNGFHLAFNNGTSTTTLGNDSSGNGNNWTPNNISLTAGSTYDWMLDSPTPYAGSSYGVGNYAVLNPLDNNGVTVSDGNLSVTKAASGLTSVRNTTQLPADKIYLELTHGSTPGGLFGFASQSAPLSSFPGSDANGVGFQPISTAKVWYNNAYTNYGSDAVAGDITMLAIDVANKKFWVGKNGTWFSNGGTGDPAAGTNPAPYSANLGSILFFMYASQNGQTGYVNFGQRPFSYTPPSGYKTLCTQNLPSPTIQNGANHFAATLYTGTGATQTLSNAVNSVSFQPDFVWVKNRGAVGDHGLFDSVRGTTKRLVSNTTAAEDTVSGVTSFNSGGFSLGVDYNGSGQTFVGWQWKAGGTAVTNTAGSITSQVSANTTAGFSVVTYTGTGANATVGHGLGVAPSMVIIKDRGAANLWVVYHSALGASGYISLNSTAAFATLSSVFNNTAPTSSVISLGIASGTNNPSMVAYCFAAIAGYSAFGSYTGNGSADGPFVFTGIRSRFILIKRSDSTANWRILDTSRDLYNVESQELYPSLASAEQVYASFDGLSNGFKIRNVDTAYNASGGTYIYACFAENPFQNSLAR